MSSATITIDYIRHKYLLGMYNIYY
ncbi:hypothetical protein SBDP1_850037 [Syntrophobacter sp. SbD1]|nr:hypothetical protein SBDP1_850037 [Syntrophobacter sp. SbD1]